MGKIFVKVGNRLLNVVSVLNRSCERENCEGELFRVRLGDIFIEPFQGNLAKLKCLDVVLENAYQENKYEENKSKEPQKVDSFLSKKSSSGMTRPASREPEKTQAADQKSESDTKSLVQVVLKRVKTHGLKWPYHPVQVLSWIFYVVNLGSYYVVILPCILSLSFVTIFVLSIVYAFINIGVLFYAIKAMWCNPTDLEVLKSRELMSKGIIPEKGKLTFFCQVCESYVSERSKHCGSCNRCVENFDHHCKWLNNCIGGKNYKTFILLIILVGIQTCYYTISGILYTILGFRKHPDDSETSLCLIERDDHKPTAILVTCLVLATTVVSLLLSIGIFMLLKLHYKLSKYSFTTYEYLNYTHERKSRLQRLKQGYITKQKFDELELKAKNKAFKKKSKVLQEVDGPMAQQTIAAKMMKKQEEAKGSIAKELHLNSKGKDKMVNETEPQMRDLGTDHPCDNALEENDLVFGKKTTQKSNNFWCSSVFCIPCTRRVNEDQNVVHRKDDLHEDSKESLMKTIINNDSTKSKRQKNSKFLRTEESYKPCSDDEEPEDDQEEFKADHFRREPLDLPHQSFSSKKEEQANTLEIFHNQGRDIENSISNKSIGSSIIERRVGFKHEEEMIYDYKTENYKKTNDRMELTKKQRLPPLSQHNNFLGDYKDQFVHKSFQRNSPRMDLLYKSSEESHRESRPSTEMYDHKGAELDVYCMDKIEEESPSLYNKKVNE
ncbi:unnamed protein product [Moneuplotes crassus]|uniref:Palmitoyltransferase n=1 Tax=Euplotes crassus TaxID=5936 RepID=A0AAD1XJH3_EUPCR|nr:unnamed protein product [Moneuplotes crassus]